MEPSSKLADGFVRFEQSARRMRTESNDYFRLNQLELRLQKRKALCYLIRLRIAVIGRAALQNIADKNIASLEPHRIDNLLKQLASPADKRSPLGVLVAPRRFAHENQLCIRIAFSRHGVRPGLTQPALTTVPYLPGYLFKFHCNISTLRRTFQFSVPLIKGRTSMIMSLKRKITGKEHVHLKMLPQGLLCIRFFAHIAPM